MQIAFIFIMDLLQFYLKIVTDEINTCGIADDTVRSALTNLCSAYSSNALQKGETVIDYNNPANRCAYVYKFCTCNTSAVKTYCRKFLKDCFEGRCIAHKMLSGSKLQFCFLGGGPGTDLVGLLQALSDYPHHPKAIGRVTIIDAFGGWRNTFNKVIENLRTNEMSSVPSTLLGSDVILKLVQADLLKPVTTKVANIIKNADIVFMVRFVSIVASDVSTKSAIENLMEIMKPGAIVFLIDNINGFEIVNSIVLERNLNVVFGPFRELYRLPEKFPGVCKEIFGCFPLLATKTCAMVWKNERKTVSLSSDSNVSNSSTPSHSSTNTKLMLSSEIQNQSMPALSKFTEMNLGNGLLSTSFAASSNASLSSSYQSSQEISNILSAIKVQCKTSESPPNKPINSIVNSTVLHALGNQPEMSVNSNEKASKLSFQKLKMCLPTKACSSSSVQDFVGLCKDTSTSAKCNSQLSLQELVSDNKNSIQGSQSLSKVKKTNDVNSMDRSLSLTTVIQSFPDSRDHLYENKYHDLSQVNATFSEPSLEKQILFTNGHEHNSGLKVSSESMQRSSVHCQTVADCLNSNTQHYQDKSCQTSHENSSDCFDFFCSKCENDQKDQVSKISTPRDILQKPLGRPECEAAAENLIFPIKSSRQTNIPQNTGEYMNNHFMEDFFTSLIKRLDQIVTTFEDMKTQLSASTSRCTCENANTECQNRQTFSSPVRDAPFLVLPLQHMEQANISQLFSAFSKPES